MKSNLPAQTTSRWPASTNGRTSRRTVIQNLLPHLHPQHVEKSSLPSAPTRKNKKREFRAYEADARPSVREFYRLNHINQTHDFALAKRKEYLGLNRLQFQRVGRDGVSGPARR